ncbi:hypothetical protein SAMN02745912_00004 [Paramaledivibacter caminithermalis DSM 15212]|jgi:hypothetical protein|uniref:Uncharacterized protein n=1 Tax=Paramaledivibacter caminithermalis (strain DSM 15212 / CIP 107654 / DViRD3) TaxID=1121301 RepID=A0A1M6JJI9_PARC5|nr:hypothetical protein SAMN02745912_00004 [Paramaledivibacter caminithermalis DSM 15212]
MDELKMLANTIQGNLIILFSIGGLFYTVVFFVKLIYCLFKFCYRKL